MKNTTIDLGLTSNSVLTRVKKILPIMPKIKSQPRATDPALADEARKAAETLAAKHLDLDIEKINLDSNLRPENPYTAAFRKAVPWSKTPKR